MQSGGDFTIDGAAVTIGPFTNAGTATLQSGSLSVGAVTNSGTLNLNGGTFARTPGATFGNSGTVQLLNAARYALDGGDGGVSGGDYVVASGATLQFTAGGYGVGSLSGAGRSEVNGANVTAANVSVRLGGQLRMLAGALSVGAVTNSGTLNLDGGTFARTAEAAFGNSGTVNLNTGTLSLDGGDGGVSGGDYAVGSGATLRFTAGSYDVGSLGGAGSSEIDGANVTAADVSVAAGGQLRCWPAR